ncbi:MAG: toll/interleukin-1 receptor domain-containing protein [Planctomycetota bacterium]|nr:toll/interleukin-1 receptor domain-containing protein [Planctomycetota bacterium]
MPVFISHSNDDNGLYTSIRGLLVKAGVPCWDEKNLRVGERLADELRGAIAQCGVCIFLATEKSLKSAWCLAELGAFWGAGKKVIIFANASLAETKLPKQFQGTVRENDAGKLVEATKEALEDVVQQPPISPVAESANGVFPSRTCSRLAEKLQFAINKSLRMTGTKEFTVMGLVVREDSTIEDSYLKVALKALKASKGLAKHVKLKVIVHDATTDNALLHLTDGTDGPLLSVRAFLESVDPDKSHRRELGIDSSTEVRITRSSPCCLSFFTPVGVFYQPYLFGQEASQEQPIIWSDGNAPLPLVKHVARVLKRRSIPETEFRNEFDLSLDVTARQMGLKNHYWPEEGPPYSGARRILHLLKTKTSRLWIKGVSLKLFLTRARTHHGDYNHLSRQVISAFIKTIKDASDIRILFFDPQCIEAKRRAFREELAKRYSSRNDQDKDVSFDEFSKRHVFGDFVTDYDKDYDKGKVPPTLMTDTKSSLESLQIVLDNIVLRDEQEVSIRYYDSGPGEFLMMTDSAAIIEPLNFGFPPETDPETDTKILSRNMPLSEFAADSGDSDTYALLEDHFKFVFQHFSRPVWKK